jgi:hypothetical protein
MIQKRIRTAFRLLAVAQSPLSIDDLVCAALTHEFNGPPWLLQEADVEKNSFIDYLGSLVTIVDLERKNSVAPGNQEKVPCVQLCHSSLQQLLLAPPQTMEQYCKREEFSSVAQYCFSASEAHELMAGVALKTKDLTFKSICGCFYEVQQCQIPCSDMPGNSGSCISLRHKLPPQTLI